MARQNIKPNPSEKLFEAYMDFSGGLNSETANESLKDNEMPVLLNVDMNTRGSVRRRSGRQFILDVQETAQGMFQFFRKGKKSPDLILAIKGKLYVMESDTTETKSIDIKDGNNAFTFQTELPI